MYTAAPLCDEYLFLLLSTVREMHFLLFQLSIYFTISYGFLSHLLLVGSIVVLRLR